VDSGTGAGLVGKIKNLATDFHGFLTDQKQSLYRRGDKGRQRNTGFQSDNIFFMKRVLLSWSSGKDSAWSLHILRQRAEYEVVGLLTTFNQVANRVAMHAVRRELVERQAAAAGLPLWAVPLSWPCSNEQYETLMAKACAQAVSEEIEGIAFGDLFLEDVRAYREKQMAGTGLEPIFPLWGLPTRALAEEMIASGTRAKLTCIDTEKLDGSFVGREFDEVLLAELPENVDPCGERGEFHSFVYAGPMFNAILPVSVGETVTRERFVFADLISK
jgi:uncharacterized protein (TIGR00290 family)